MSTLPDLSSASTDELEEMKKRLHELKEERDTLIYKEKVAIKEKEAEIKHKEEMIRKNEELRKERDDMLKTIQELKGELKSVTREKTKATTLFNMALQQRLNLDIEDMEAIPKDTICMDAWWTLH